MVPVAYEVPDSVTVAPTGPDEGVSVSVGAVIVNEAAPLSKLPSDPFAVTV